MGDEKTYERLVFANPEFPLIVIPSKISGGYDESNESKTWHEALEIKLFIEGEATVLIDSNAILAEKDDIVIINPYEYHAMLDSFSNTRKYHLFMLGTDFFNSKNIDGFDMKYLLLGRRIKFNNILRGNEAAKNILLRIVEEFSEKKQAYELAVRGLVLELFAMLLRSEVNTIISEEALNDTVRFYAVVEPAIRDIRNLYMTQLSIDALAEACKMSKFHFCRIFKRCTGLTAVQYLTEYRLSMADVLLKNSEKNITEIAEAVGFRDESYFSRCYKKVRGVSPNKARAI